MIEAVIETEILVIGGGAAGSFAAVRARELGAEVLLVNKGIYGRDGAATWMAGPAFQAALYQPDSPETHARDVIKIGRYLADQQLVYEYTARLPGIAHRLEEWGVRFEKRDGKFVMSRLPGESHPRVVTVPRVCVFSGSQYRRVLPRQVRRMGVRVMNDVFVYELLHRDGMVVGVLGLDLRSGKPVVIRAKSVILATGGYMGSYSRTMVPMATGDGIAMAYRAGVEVVDMEMADFYTYVAVWPPAARDEEWPALLAYDLNAIMYNSLGEEYMKRYTGPKRVPPRAAAAEIRAGHAGPHGGVYMSVRHLPVNLVEAYLGSMGSQRFLDVLTEAGFDLRNEALEIVPAAITSFGGCKINFRCETNLAGLYAAGEASSGHQGAYVMVGNMVGASSATGCIAAEQAVARAGKSALAEVDLGQVEAGIRQVMALRERSGSGCRPVQVKKTVKAILDRSAHVAGRTDAGIRRGLVELEDVEKNLAPDMCVSDSSPRFSTEWVQALEAVNQTQVARLVLISALERTESRGVHYRDDYPEESHEWLKRIVIRRVDDKDELRHEPVVFPHIKPPERVK